ncbi:MAG: response regulator, partial [Oscillospiraceae bacterium]|nr:response regulator [Oscillospiraceae bacterium]
EKVIPDLILLDVDMPVIDGFEALEKLKADARTRDVPVIFLTARTDCQAELRGFEMGALDFINKPFSPPSLIKRIECHIEMDKLLKKSRQEVRDVHNALINVISDLVETRDKVTGSGHIKRTQKYLELLIGELIRGEVYGDEISLWDTDLVIPAAQLHDVGKICTNEFILKKPDKLTPGEFEAVKLHCIEGERILNMALASKDDAFLEYALRFAAYHHEKWDGTGYPRGLRGEDIPIEGRIMAVVDVYDILVTKLSYKDALSHDEAVGIISRESGKHFDPKIAAAFINIADDIRAAFTLWGDCPP